MLRPVFGACACIILLLQLAAEALIVEPEWKIYYDVTTNKTIDIIDTSNPRLHYYKAATQRLFRIGFGPIPCSCLGMTCGCCAGMNIAYFDFNQRACMNFTYDPHEFSLKMDMIMNENSLYAQSISGKNPPPACIPMPIPYLPSIDMCIKFFNIHTPGYNIFMCIDFETRIERAPVLVLHFDCMQMGMEGISYHKPEDAAYEPEIEDADSATPIVQNGEQEEVYDEVFEDEGSTKTPPKSMMNVENADNNTKAQTEEVYDEVFEEDQTTPNLGTERYTEVQTGDEVYDEVTEDKKSRNL